MKLLSPAMKAQSIRYWILASDLLWILGALGLAVALRYLGVGDGVTFLLRCQTYSFMVSVALAAWTFLYFEMGLDGFKGGWYLPAVLSKIVVAALTLIVCILAFGFITRQYYSRLVLLFFILLFMVGLLGIRCSVRLLLSSHLRNEADHRCVVLGQGPVAQELAAKIASHPEVPFQIFGFLFPGEPDLNGLASSETPFTSLKTLQILELLAKQNVRKLIIAMPQPDGPEIRNLIAACRRAAIDVFLVPQWYDLYLSKAELTEIDGLPLLSLQERHPGAVEFVLKRALDVGLSLASLILFAPLLALAAIVVRTKKGTAFRTEIRCGKGGVPFRMYRLNVDRHAAGLQAYEKLFLRWSFTELPQLWNVLRGEMSLVGPRPESPQRVRCYSEWQRQRLKVQAGVTGLAQVHGLREQHSSEEKARFDLQYIFNWSPLLDLSLIVQTVWTVLTRGLRQESLVPQPVRFRTQRNEFIAEDIN